MRELRGKVAVVTGAASGIGRAMAERFAREGMKLVLADVQEKPLAEARDAIARGGAEVIAVPTDVSKWEQVDALAKRAFEAYGAAHVVCNNAGVGTGGVTWEMSPADWEWVFGVNQWSVVHGIRAFVPRMIAQGEGHIVNTASIAGLLSAPGMGAYCATKHAVVAISECLHLDLAVTGNGSKVHVSVVCPAWVKTSIADSERNRPASLPRREGQERSAQEQMLEASRRRRSPSRCSRRSSRSVSGCSRIPRRRRPSSGGCGGSWRATRRSSIRARCDHPARYLKTVLLRMATSTPTMLSPATSPE
jgi:NAD(P)-dependent dehydrogenase (short-subunit alcohol dehydrogenase family)